MWYGHTDCSCQWVRSLTSYDISSIMFSLKCYSSFSSSLIISIVIQVMKSLLLGDSLPHISETLAVKEILVCMSATVRVDVAR